MTQPKWARLAEAIREMIRTGDGLDERDGGRYLPSYEALVERDWPGIGRVSYGTIRHVQTILRAQGWIEGEPGVGVRVREDHPA